MSNCWDNIYIYISFFLAKYICHLINGYLRAKVIESGNYLVCVGQDDCMCSWD